MGCRCGGKRRNEGTQATLIRSQARMSVDLGVYPTAPSAQVDCSGPYTGGYEGRVVYVVALGTDNERIFAEADKAEAIELARVNEWTADPLPVSKLCHESVVAALGG